MVLVVTAMTRQEIDELFQFRIESFPPLSCQELLQFHDDIFQSKSEFARTVAEVVFEEKCLGSFYQYMKQLRAVGYERLEVEPTLLRASPKIPPEWDAPLWRITRGFFPVNTSLGSDNYSSHIGISLVFPRRLVGQVFDLTNLP